MVNNMDLSKYTDVAKISWGDLINDKSKFNRLADTATNISAIYSDALLGNEGWIIDLLELYELHRTPIHVGADEDVGFKITLDKIGGNINISVSMIDEPYLDVKISYDHGLVYTIPEDVAKSSLMALGDALYRVAFYDDPDLLSSPVFLACNEFVKVGFERRTNIIYFLMEDKDFRITPYKVNNIHKVPSEIEFVNVQSLNDWVSSIEPDYQ